MQPNVSRLPAAARAWFSFGTPLDPDVRRPPLGRVAQHRPAHGLAHVAGRRQIGVVVEDVLAQLPAQRKPVLVLGRVGDAREPRGHLAVGQRRDRGRADDEDDLGILPLHLVAPVRERVLDLSGLEVQELAVELIRLVGSGRVHALLSLPRRFERRPPATPGREVSLVEHKAVEPKAGQLAQPGEHDVAERARDVERRPALANDLRCRRTSGRSSPGSSPSRSDSPRPCASSSRRSRGPRRAASSIICGQLGSGHGSSSPDLT